MVSLRHVSVLRRLEECTCPGPVLANNLRINQAKSAVWPGLARAHYVWGLFITREMNVLLKTSDTLLRPLQGFFLTELGIGISSQFPPTSQFASTTTSCLEVGNASSSIYKLASLWLTEDRVTPTLPPWSSWTPGHDGRSIVKIPNRNIPMIGTVRYAFDFFVKGIGMTSQMSNYVYPLLFQKFSPDRQDHDYILLWKSCLAVFPIGHQYTEL